MKKINLILLGLTILALSNNSYGQSIDEKKINDKIISKLNTPTKIWTNGHWETGNDGIKYWKKGYWKFKEKTFQQKSEIFRKKTKTRNKA